jgi:hypothetical protein
MAKKAFVYDGTQWVDIAQSTTDLTNYANMTTTPISGFRNAIINGDFRVWQRGTSFSSPTNGTFVSDRWLAYFDGTGATRTISQQPHTLGVAPVAGYESEFFIRYNQSVAGTGATYNEYNHKIEGVRTFAGQTVTLSFWAKAASTTSLPFISLRQEFGTGGSPSSSVITSIASSVSVGTSWTRFTFTVTLPSISGKTLGSTNNNNLTLLLGFPLNSVFTVDIWGVQLEKGTIATPFEQRPIGTELALCQRYYIRYSNGAALQPLGTCSYYTTTSAGTHVIFPVEMREKPVGGESAASAIIVYSAGTSRTSTGIADSQMSTKASEINITTSAATAGNAGVSFVTANNWIDFSAEL